MSRRRTRRTAQEDAIRESADEPTPVGEELEADAQAREDAATEIDTGVSELEQDPDREERLDGLREKVTMPVEGREDFDRGLDELDLEDDGEPAFDPEIFECGPLAAGIRMLEALLAEAISGYITAQIEELGRVLDIDISPDEKRFLGTVASRERTASGLPDVAGAYQALVRVKAQLA